MSCVHFFSHLHTTAGISAGTASSSNDGGDGGCGEAGGVNKDVCAGSGGCGSSSDNSGGGDSGR